MPKEGCDTSKSVLGVGIAKNKASAVSDVIRLSRHRRLLAPKRECRRLQFMEIR